MKDHVNDDDDDMIMKDRKDSVCLYFSMTVLINDEYLYLMLRQSTPAKDES